MEKRDFKSMAERVLVTGSVSSTRIAAEKLIAGMEKKGTVDGATYLTLSKTGLKVVLSWTGKKPEWLGGIKFSTLRIDILDTEDTPYGSYMETDPRSCTVMKFNDSIDSHPIQHILKAAVKSI
jgi:hypothetical protein